MKKILYPIMLILLICMLTACNKQETEATATNEAVIQKYTVDDPDATDLVAYFGNPIESEFEQIPTYDNYLLSQEKAYVSDFKGTRSSTPDNNDLRRIFFKEKIDKVTLEYLEHGYSRAQKKELPIEEIETGRLYRVNPEVRMYFDRNVICYDYVTFYIKVGEKNYYMTWIQK